MKDENINIEEYTTIFKALAHPTRLTIAYNLMLQPECNVSKMCECLQIPQPTVSESYQDIRANRQGLIFTTNY